MRLILAAARRVRTAWRSCLRWRTVLLMEQLDADVRDLRYLRDVQIPALLARAGDEKRVYLAQLAALSDLPIPTLGVDALAACPAPWSPSAPQPQRPLFSTRRNRT